MLSSFIIVISFISIIPVPQKLIPQWDSHSLRYFCPMLAVSGGLFALLWLSSWQMLLLVPSMSSILRGFLMTIITLSLTGGLHLDGLMDSCDAIFSHRDRQTRLQILSDTHAGSFAVIGCVIILLAKTLLFSELITHSINPSLVPAYSRLGMAVLMNNLPFAKSGGLAVMLGSSRRKKDNIFFALIMILLCLISSKFSALVFVICVIFWRHVCIKLFGGITGDLLGAFVEGSEVIMLMGMVISECI